MKKRKICSTVVAMALLVVSLYMPGNVVRTKASGYGLSNPKIEKVVISGDDGQTEEGTINNPLVKATVTTWDCIYFGNYWKEDTNGDGTADKNDEKTPIKWRVLSVDGDDAFLLADQNLDVQRYNDTGTSVTWETCTMRSWLNGYGASENVCGIDYSFGNFLDYAFTDGEQSVIKTRGVVNDDNSSYGSEGGNNTSDKVYLLSIGEVTNPEYGFTSSTDSTETREAVNTAYVAGGGEINCSYMIGAGGTDLWWLRSPGDNSYNAFNVGSYGDAGPLGVTNNFAVRPALHLDLSSVSDWSYAGTVSSDGGADGEATPTLEPTMKPTVAPTSVPMQTPNAENPSDSGKSIGSNETAPVIHITPEPSATAKPEAKSIGTVTGLKVTMKKKQAAVTWKKATGAKGYQICYSTSKKFKKKKQKFVKKNKVSIKKLKSGKTYFIRVRAYATDGNRKVYGKWSSVKKVKAKK